VAPLGRCLPPGARLECHGIGDATGTLGRSPVFAASCSRIRPCSGGSDRTDTRTQNAPVGVRDCATNIAMYSLLNRHSSPW